MIYYNKGRFFTSRKYPDPDDDNFFFGLSKEIPRSIRNDTKLSTQQQNLNFQKNQEDFSKDTQKKSVSQKKTLNFPISYNDDTNIYQEANSSEKINKILDEAFEEIKNDKYTTMKRKNYNIKETKYSKFSFNEKQIKNEDFLEANKNDNSDSIYMRKDKIKIIEKVNESSSSYGTDDKDSNQTSKKFQIESTNIYNCKTPQFPKNQIKNDGFRSAKAYHNISNHSKPNYGTSSNYPPTPSPSLQLSGSMSPMEPLTPLEIRFRRDFESFVRNSSSTPNQESKLNSKKQKTPNANSKKKIEQSRFYNSAKPYKVDLIKKQNDRYGVVNNTNGNLSNTSQTVIIDKSSSNTCSDNYDYSYDDNHSISHHHSNKYKQSNNNYDTYDSDIKYVNSNYIKNFNYNNNDDYLSYSSSFIQNDIKKNQNIRYNLSEKDDNSEYESYASSTLSQIKPSIKNNSNSKAFQIPNLNCMLSENDNERIHFDEKYHNNDNNYSYFDYSNSNVNYQISINNDDDYDSSSNEIIHSKLKYENNIKSNMNRNALANSMSPHPNSFWNYDKKATNSSKGKSRHFNDKKYLSDQQIQSYEEQNNQNTKSEVEIDIDLYGKKLCITPNSNKSSKHNHNSYKSNQSCSNNKLIIIQNDLQRSTHSKYQSATNEISKLSNANITSPIKYENENYILNGKSLSLASSQSKLNFKDNFESNSSSIQYKNASQNERPIKNLLENKSSNSSSFNQSKSNSISKSNSLQIKSTDLSGNQETIFTDSKTLTSTPSHKKSTSDSNHSSISPNYKNTSHFESQTNSPKSISNTNSDINSKSDYSLAQNTNTSKNGNQKATDNKSLSSSQKSKSSTNSKSVYNSPQHKGASQNGNQKAILSKNHSTGSTSSKINSSIFSQSNTKSQFNTPQSERTTLKSEDQKIILTENQSSDSILSPRLKSDSNLNSKISPQSKTNTPNSLSNSTASPQPKPKSKSNSDASQYNGTSQNESQKKNLININLSKSSSSSSPHSKSLNLQSNNSKQISQNASKIDQQTKQVSSNLGQQLFNIEEEEVVDRINITDSDEEKEKGVGLEEINENDEDEQYMELSQHPIESSSGGSHQDFIIDDDFSVQENENKQTTKPKSKNSTFSSSPNQNQLQLMQHPISDLQNQVSDNSEISDEGHRIPHVTISEISIEKQENTIEKGGIIENEYDYEEIEESRSFRNQEVAYEYIQNENEEELQNENNEIIIIPYEEEIQPEFDEEIKSIEEVNEDHFNNEIKIEEEEENEIEINSEIDFNEEENNYEFIINEEENEIEINSEIDFNEEESNYELIINEEENEIEINSEIDFNEEENQNEIIIKKEVEVENEIIMNEEEEKENEIDTNEEDQNEINMNEEENEYEVSRNNKEEETGTEINQVKEDNEAILYSNEEDNDANNAIQDEKSQNAKFSIDATVTTLQQEEIVNEEEEYLFSDLNDSYTNYEANSKCNSLNILIEEEEEEYEIIDTNYEKNEEESQLENSQENFDIEAFKVKLLNSSDDTGNQNNSHNRINNINQINNNESNHNTGSTTGSTETELIQRISLSLNASGSSSDSHHINNNVHTSPHSLHENSNTKEINDDDIPRRIKVIDSEDDNKIYDDADIDFNDFEKKSENGIIQNVNIHNEEISDIHSIISRKSNVITNLSHSTLSNSVQSTIKISSAEVSAGTSNNEEEDEGFADTDEIEVESQNNKKNDFQPNLLSEDESFEEDDNDIKVTSKGSKSTINNIDDILKSKEYQSEISASCISTAAEEESLNDNKHENNEIEINKESKNLLNILKKSNIEDDENQEIPSNLQIYEYEEDRNDNNKFDSSASTLSSLLKKDDSKSDETKSLSIIKNGSIKEDEIDEIELASGSMPHSENDIEADFNQIDLVHSNISNSNLTNKSRDDSTAPFWWERLKDPKQAEIFTESIVNDVISNELDNEEEVKEDISNNEDHFINDEKDDATEIKIDVDADDLNEKIGIIINDDDNDEIEVMIGSDLDDEKDGDNNNNNAKDKNKIHNTADLLKQIDSVLQDFYPENEEENDNENGNETLTE